MINMLLRWTVCLFLFTAIAFSQSSFWVPTAGPLHISVSAMAINSQGDVFAGTYTRGIYLSTNNGGSWGQVNNGLPLSRVYAIAVSQAQRNHDYVFVATRATGVYRSSDKGASWYPAGLADDSTYIEALATDQDGNLYASSHHTWNNISTIYRSTNNGSTWMNMYLENPLVHTNIPFILAPTSGKYTGNIFAGTNWGVYRSTDDGISWGRVVPTGSNFQVNSFAVNYRGDMYAAATDSAVYKSRDGGLHWDKVSVTIDKVLALAITPNGVLFAATYGSGVFRSLDDGASWQSLQSGLEDELMLCLVYVDAGPFDTYMYAGGTGLGTYMSRNSTTPFSLNRYDVLFGDVKVGQNKVDSIVVLNRDTTTLTISPVTTTHQYYSVTPEEVTLNIGESAKFYVTFTPAWYGNFDGTVQFVSSANSTPDEVLLYGTGLSPDTKIPFSNILSYGRVYLGHYSVQSTRIKNIGNDTLHFGNMFTSDSVFTVYTDVTHVLPGEFAEIFVKFTPTVHGPYSGFAVLESNSISSPDTVWMNGFGRGYPVVQMNVEGEVMFGHVKIGKEKDTTFSFTNVGVDTLWILGFETNNSQFNVKIDHSPVPPGEKRNFIIQFTPFAKGETFGTLYLHSNALSSPDSIKVHGLADPATDIETIGGVPGEFILYQNFPNPFNPATTIRFGMPQEGGVKITMYNQLGIQVATIADEILPAGYYESHWRNNGSLPSGVYYYRILIRSVRAVDDQRLDPPVITLFDEMKKLILIK